MFMAGAKPRSLSLLFLALFLPLQHGERKTSQMTFLLLLCGEAQELRNCSTAPSSLFCLLHRPRGSPSGGASKALATVPGAPGD